MIRTVDIPRLPPLRPVVRPAVAQPAPAAAAPAPDPLADKRAEVQRLQADYQQLQDHPPAKPDITHVGVHEMQDRLSRQETDLEAYERSMVDTGGRLKIAQAELQRMTAEADVTAAAGQEQQANSAVQVAQQAVDRSRPGTIARSQADASLVDAQQGLKQAQTVNRHGSGPPYRLPIGTPLAGCPGSA